MKSNSEIKQKPKQEMKSLHQINEDISQLHTSIHDKAMSVHKEITKVENFQSKQSEVRLGITGGFFNRYYFLTMQEFSNKVVIIQSNYSSQLSRNRYVTKIRAKKGIVPKQVYATLWTLLETNNIWELADNRSLRKNICDADNFVVSVSKDGKRNDFRFYGLVPPVLTNAYYVSSGIDETTAKSLKNYSETITLIRCYSKLYATRKINIKSILKDIAKDEKELEEKEKELRQHPRFIADAYRRKGKLCNAIKWYKRTIEHLPHDYDAQYWLPMLYEQTGKTDKALEQWQKFLQITEGIESQKVWSVIAKNRMKKLKEE